jgi:hypothetical protein
MHVYILVFTILGYLIISLARRRKKKNIIWICVGRGKKTKLKPCPPSESGKKSKP